MKSYPCWSKPVRKSSLEPRKRVGSQRRKVTTGDEGARGRQSGRRHVSAGLVGQSPKQAEALGVRFTPSRNETWLRCVDQQSDWWGPFPRDRPVREIRTPVNRRN